MPMKQSVLTESALVLALTVGLASASAENGTDVGQCEFDSIPEGVGYFWDTACTMGDLGCNADGKHVECRFCGAGTFIDVPCPPSSCKFPNHPHIPFYWDTECEVGKLGCWADGIHTQCRFCGDFPYTSIPCPDFSPRPEDHSCTFKDEPKIPYYWDSDCEMGKHGCNADGNHTGCRFCGAGDFADIHCPASQLCEFELPPTVPYYWDPQCQNGVLGCKADGIHIECRFCAARPFENVPCPEPVAPPNNTCVWPLRGEPLIPYYWDDTCTMGVLGCWADGIHSSCRFCGKGAYEQVACPNATGQAGQNSGFLGR